MKIDVAREFFVEVFSIRSYLIKTDYSFPSLSLRTAEKNRAFCHIDCTCSRLTFPIRAYNNVCNRFVYINYGAISCKLFVRRRLSDGCTWNTNVGLCNLIPTFQKISPESGGSVFLRNVGIYLQAHVALQSGSISIFSPLWRPYISHNLTTFFQNIFLIQGDSKLSYNI
jgi:hypothetical protein